MFDMRLIPISTCVENILICSSIIELLSSKKNALWFWGKLFQSQYFLPLKDKTRSKRFLHMSFIQRDQKESVQTRISIKHLICVLNKNFKY